VNIRRTLTVGGLSAIALVGLASCEMNNAPAANKQDQQTMGDIASRMQNAQPIPAEPWSQYRQTLIDAETAQMRGTQTTTFVFSRGAGGQGNPIFSCPSLGFPVPASAQLSNPSQPLWGSNGASNVIGQMEPNGVYTGETSGTYVICAGSGGKPYLVYAEGDAQTVGGPAEWRDGKITLTGDPTIKPGTKK
jgi:hypothetical protein